ncbi:MAG: potassium efflux system protein [Lysobacterales bacterium]|nr:MAG: potassium efflux system protein [Xanthomonadales bacterium]
MSGHDVFQEIALLLLAAAAVGALLLRLKQPLIIAYMLVGLAVGPSVLGWITASAPVELFAEIGVTVLLFVVGLKLDLHLIRRLGKVALATGLGQLGFTIVIGFLIGLALGMGWVRALYIAIALTFSSTIIIVKLLSDKRELDSLHGRIAMGFLIVQDIAVVVAMMIIGTQGAGGEGDAGARALEVLLKLGGLTLLVGALMRFVLPKLMTLAAESQELLLVFAVAWGTALAAAGEWLGFSKEVGAFLAGFSLASLPFREAIHARLASLRDFLLLFFFVHLGTQLDLRLLGDEIGAALLFSLFVLIGNPLIVMAIMGYMGYRKRTGFLAGLTVAQISEFSILFMAMGVAVGHVDQAALGLVTLVGLITITLSTYMILYSQQLFAWFEPFLGIFERRQPFREDQPEERVLDPEVLLFGFGRYGRRFAECLSQAGARVLAIDFDPEALAAPRPPSVEVVFGAVEDEEFIGHLPLAKARVAISTLRNRDVDQALIAALRRHGFKGKVLLTAVDGREAEALREAGADHVFLPWHDAAEFAARRVLQDLRHP